MLDRSSFFFFVFVFFLGGCEVVIVDDEDEDEDEMILTIYRILPLLYLLHVYNMYTPLTYMP